MGGSNRRRQVGREGEIGGGKEGRITVANIPQQTHCLYRTRERRNGKWGKEEGTSEENKV